MFENLQPAPPDAILGLTDAYLADPNPDKINLGVGVYQDEHGETPVLHSVKSAEQRLVDSEATKSYRPIEGAPEYRQAVQRLLLGDASADTAPRGIVTAGTPGGTGALRVAADYLADRHGGLTLWLPDPTWPNHPSVFEAAGLPIRTYPYFDPAANALAFEPLIDALTAAPAGDVVLLHGCCHNPTGIDPTSDQWAAIAGVLAERGLLPLVDFAYQGFGDGLESDAVGFRTLAEHNAEVMACTSYSKNFGLYRERVGALTVLAASDEDAQNVLGHVKRVIRRNYSNPPSHGESVVSTILDNAQLRSQWEAELAGMRERIHAMRRLLASGLDARGVSLSPNGNGFITRQRGMFSFTGLSKPQVARLRDRHAIYMVGSGRINVAGIREANVERLCDAIARERG